LSFVCCGFLRGASRLLNCCVGGASGLNLVYVFFALLLLIFNVWSLYNIPIVLVGVRHLLRSAQRSKGRENALFDEKNLPFVSIIVPVKNEEKVIDRLLRALLSLRYPRSRMEVIVVNDESHDRTGEICEYYVFRYRCIRVFNRVKSSTKAAALNFGVSQSRGEIIATFDADSVPETDSVLKAVKYFEDPRVTAVQGQIRSINADENMLTKFLSYEGSMYYEAFVGGRDRLGFFVSLGGSCQFIRRAVLLGVGGWDEGSLSEDMELSLRLTERDCCIRYASDVRTWEERPNSVPGLLRQRDRWYRGNIENSLRFGRLLKRLSLKRFDAEMTLLGTYLIALCLASYFMALWSFLFPPDFVLTGITQVTSFCVVFLLAFAGVALVYATKPLKLTSLLWLPFVYAYLSFQSLIVLYSMLQIVFRRPRTWSKTARSGIVTDERVIDVLARSSG